jgi:predicted CoA-binding protein
MADWQDNLVTDPQRIGEVVRSLKRVAVLGIKTEQQADAPAFTVPRYLQGQGVEIVPVPTYYPEVTTILGQPVYRKLADIPGHLDCVDVFRRPQDIDAHLPELLASKPRVVWFQLGIVNHAAAETLAKAGILVVQDRCLLVEHRKHAA